MLVMKCRICVPNVNDLRKAKMEEALYKRKCRTPLCQDDINERKLEDVELIEATSEKIKIIRDRLKTTKKLCGYLENSFRI